jgi:uncharacterized membrane protein YcaP (DUF421 family)
MALDWHSMFVPSVSIAEMVVRGTIMYLVLFALLRFVLKRQSGGLGITDVLVIVLIADAAQNGMASEYRSVTEGIVLVATIIFWSYALDWLGYHFPTFQRLLHPAPLLLVKDGQMLRRNMRQELVTPDELMTQLREEGIKDLCDVHRAFMEADGSISVIEADKINQERGPKQRSGRSRTTESVG